MNETPIFKNEMPYDIDVPTPSGAGRRVPPNCYVIGDYFYDVARQTGKLKQMPAGYKPDPKLIVCAMSKTDVIKIFNPYITAVSTPATMEEATEGIQETKAVSFKEETYSPEEALKKGMEAMQQSAPTVNDLEKMSTVALRKLASKMGMMATGNRENLLSVLREQLKG